MDEYEFKGAESTIRKVVARLRHKIGPAPKSYVPLSASWGEQAQVDWGQAVVRMNGEEMTVHLFCMRLRASGACFVRAYPGEKLEGILDGHRTAFDYFGGIPGECWYDNLKTAVKKILSGPRRVEHEQFTALKIHYLFRSHFCGAGKGNEKGSVENLVGYVRRNALVPKVPIPEYRNEGVVEIVRASIRLRCEELRLPTVERYHVSLAEEVSARDGSREEYLLSCLTKEVEVRTENRMKAALRRARFPTVKTLESFDFTRMPDLPRKRILELASGEFAKRKENIVCLGQAGTGKSHTGIALGMALVSKGMSVRFVTAVNLAQELLAAKDEHRLPKALKSYDKFDLVIVDELGYIGLGLGGPMLFQFFSDRYDK